MKSLFLKLFLSVVFMASTVGIVCAQDVIKVSPETHQVLFENDQVRVIKVHMKPGQKVGMHSHPNGSILYYMSNAKVRITFPDGKTEVREVKADTASWSGPVTHAAENIGTTDLLEIQSELKTVPNKKAAN